MIQGSHASKYHFFFGFSLKGFQTCWFFHQSVGSMVICYIPPNLFDNKSWIGFSLYVTLKGHPYDLLNNDNDSVTPHSLYIDLHTHGSSISHVATVTLPIDAKYSNQLLLFHAPQQFLKEELNHCWEVSAFLRTGNPDVEVEMCGIRVVYKQDLGDLIEMIFECALGGPNDEHHHRLC
ncbi:uncharacterized protein LOC125418508 [Ziziphus jujuba]|uniref:Uncharacterized protein LOC125418508 n=1 Tax=Ziziphus jujuba TaxID=326968 RepID=A0ABM3I2L7_ZIZJJ|nr:uncharacterized protein LOC125418508 [Ziziphus jujuba]